MAFEEQQPFDPASFEHIPVLLNECLTGLAIDPAGTYLDGTAGGAGHSRQIALRLDAANLSCDLPRIGLLAVIPQDAGQFLAAFGVHKVCGGLALLAHAHIQRRVCPVGKAPGGIV